MAAYETEKGFGVFELVTLKGGERVFACSQTMRHEDEAIGAAQDCAAEAADRKQDRYFAVMPVTWIRQC